MNNRGSVLIIVLWSLFFLTMLAVAVHAYVAPFAVLSGKLTGRTKMLCFANAGVERAIFEIENDDTKFYDSFFDSWSRNDEAFDHVPIGGGTFSAIKSPALSDAKPEYGLTDEEGKININKASQQVLRNLFNKVAHVELEDAEAIADAILDWRDQDDMPHKNGKENDYYESLEHAYECKNSDFEAPEELLLVAGVTSGMFDAVKDSITIYGEGTVNVNTASIPVLMSLGMEEALAGKVVRFRAGTGIQKEGEIPEGVFTDVPTIADRLAATGRLSGEEITQIQRTAPLGVRSDHFRGEILGAYLGGERTETITFVYDRMERIVKYWREGS